MRRIFWIGILAASSWHGLAGAPEIKVTFDEAPPPRLPGGWQSGITGQGQARWEVVPDPTAPSPPNALRQSGKATFAWAAKTDVKLKNGFAEVKFKALQGKEDEAGGIVFRFRDGNNYYVARANALEDNVVLYKTVNGKRSSLPVKGRASGYGIGIKVPKGKWNHLRVEFKGDLFTVYFNGQQLFQVVDRTFPGPGAVGLWTKADSVTAFDDFSFGGN